MTVSIADMVEQMLAAGVPHEMIVLAVHTAESARHVADQAASQAIETAEERRKRKDRERQAAKREALRAAQAHLESTSSMDASADKSTDNADIGADVSMENPRTIHGQSTDITDEPARAYSINSTSSLDEDSGKKEKKQTSRGRTCPPEFQPTEKHYELGAKHGHSREQVDQIAVEMREWSEANKNRPVARKANWDLTLNGFIRRATGPPRHVNGTGATKKTVHQAADDLLATLRSLDAPAPSDLRDGAGQAPVRVLPPR